MNRGLAWTVGISLVLVVIVFVVLGIQGVIDRSMLALAAIVLVFGSAGVSVAVVTIRDRFRPCPLCGQRGTLRPLPDQGYQEVSRQEFEDGYRTLTCRCEACGGCSREKIYVGVPD